jgi:putative membrane protein
MNRWSLIALMLFSCAVFQACDGRVGDNDGADVSKDAAKTPLEAGDQQFMAQAGSGRLTQIELGQLAEKNGGNLRIKNFGKMMIKDQVKADRVLFRIAKNNDVDLPAAPDAEGRAVISSLSQKTGRDFDKAYISNMIMDDNNAIKTFEYASKNCSNPDIKTFARKSLPVLKNHLDAIETIDESMK